MAIPSLTHCVPAASAVPLHIYTQRPEAGTVSNLSGGAGSGFPRCSCRKAQRQPFLTLGFLPLPSAIVSMLLLSRRGLPERCALEARADQRRNPGRLLSPGAVNNDRVQTPKPLPLQQRDQGLEPDKQRMSLRSTDASLPRSFSRQRTPLTELEKPTPELTSPWKAGTLTRSHGQLPGMFLGNSTPCAAQDPI